MESSEKSFRPRLAEDTSTSDISAAIEETTEAFQRAATGGSEMTDERLQQSDEEKDAEVRDLNSVLPNMQQESGAAPISKQQSRLSRVATGFFSSRLQEDRKVLVFKFFFNHFLLWSLIIAVFSLYWGATYKRTSYYYKVNILAVIQDEGSLVQELPSLISKSPGTWHIYNSSSFQAKYDISPVQVDSKITELVHHQKFWMSLNVRPNATSALIDSLNTTEALPFNSSRYFETVYESGRDPTNMKSSILPLMLGLEAMFQQYYTTSYLPSLLGNYSSRLSQVSSANLASAGVMQFNQVDYRPFTNYVLLGPLQVGLIYCILLTFFQLSVFASIHARLAPKLKPVHMILYRFVIGWVNYFFLSLFFCVVSSIFHVDYNVTYGRAGFVVAWMSSWLLMIAVGGANENMLTILMAFGPQYLGFWMVFWVVFNISPSFYPMALTNNFYRYGYMAPIHNGVDIFRVIFLGLYPGHLGRNYGILCAWIGVNSLLFPLCLKVFAAKKKKDAAKAAAAAANHA